MSDLKSRLRALGLIAAADDLDNIVALATKQRWGPVQVLEHVADLEERERAKRSLERRLKSSRIGKFKPMADFDWAWPTKIERPRVETALELGFVERARNVVLVAPQGLGKTTIAQNIAHNAI